MGERARFFLALALLVVGIVGLAIVGAEDGEEGEWVGYAILGIAVLIALTLAHGIPGQR